MDRPEEKLVHIFKSDTIQQYQKKLIEEAHGVGDWSGMAAAMNRACVTKRRRAAAWRKNEWWNEECYAARVRTKTS